MGKGERGVVPEMSHNIKLNGNEAVRVVAMLFKASASQ